MTSQREKTPFQQLQALAASGAISRREFMKRATLIGLTTPAVVGLLSACADDDTSGDLAPEDDTSGDSEGDTDEGAGEDEADDEPDSADDEETEESDEESEDSGESSGGILRLVDGTDIPTIDPPNATGPFSHVVRAIFETLLGYTDEMEPTGLLATDWEVDEEGGTTWTFNLKEGVMFHDGTEFTSEAVRVTLERIVDPELDAARGSLFEVITNVDDSEPYTAVIETDGLFPDLPFLMADRSACIVSPTAHEEYGYDEFGQNPVGTGPMQFVEMVPGDHVTLERFEDYHDGPIALEGMEFMPVPEASSREAMIRAGEADIVLSPPLQSVEALREEDGIEVDVRDTVTQVTSEMRQSQEPFSIKEVRQAMNYAIDSQSIIDEIMAGFGTVCDSPALPGVWAYEAQEPYSYDPDRAQELLAEAGYEDGFDGDLFYVSGRWAGDDEVTEAMVAYWSNVGINIEIERIDMGSLGDYLRFDPDENPGLTTQQFRTSAYQDYHLYRLFHSDSTHEVAAQRSNYENPEVDELIDQARATLDQDEREELYKEAQRLIWDDAAFVWIFVMQKVLTRRSGVSGYRIMPDEEFYVKDVQFSG